MKFWWRLWLKELQDPELKSKACAGKIDSGVMDVKSWVWMRWSKKSVERREERKEPLRKACNTEGRM